MAQFAQQVNPPTVPQGMPFPMPAFPQFPVLQPPTGQPNIPGIPFTAPFAMPFPTQSAPNGMPAAGLQGMTLPQLGSLPQPYMLYEQALKVAIDLLGKMLAQSEATHPENGQASDGEGSSGQQSAPVPGPVPPMPFMPDFGSGMPPMQPPMQPGSEIGMMPRNTPMGSLMGLLFGASNTDYFYED